MEAAVNDAVEQLVPIIEALGAIIIVVGAIVAFAQWVIRELRPRERSYENVRLRLGRHLALGLEFLLGADILTTAVSPSWDDIGKLAAIAGIRTALNYFLTREIEAEAAREAPAQA